MLKSAIVKSSFSPKGFLRSFDTGWIRCLFILSYFRLFFRKNPAFFIFPGEKRGHEKRAAASSALLRVSPLAGPNCATAPIILLVGYALYLLYGAIKKEKRENILYLNIVGILVQLGWEASLLINGIRPRNAASVKTRIIDSLIETNLGRPYLYFIVKAISSHFNEDGKKKNLNEKPNS